MRAILDAFDVGGRLRYIRDFVWRGGVLHLETERSGQRQLLNVWYALTARWAAAVLERSPQRINGRVAWDRPVIDGRWVRGSSGYEVRVGIDLRAPSALYIRSRGFRSHVPFLGRSPADVEHCLQGELQEYVRGFVSHCEPVPQRVALEAQRLRRLGLAA
jgi:hypothetical protein